MCPRCHNGALGPPLLRPTAVAAARLPRLLTSDMVSIGFFLRITASTCLLRPTAVLRPRTTTMPLRMKMATQLQRMETTTMPAQIDGEAAAAPTAPLPTQGAQYYPADFAIAPWEWRMVATTLARRLRWLPLRGPPPPTDTLDVVSSSS
jgi:hypothetical protein